MILRPVTPQSPFGPPISNAPVGLTRYLTGPLIRFLGSTGLMTSSITASESFLWSTPAACCVDRTTVSTASGQALAGAQARLKMADGRYAAGVGSIIELSDAELAAALAGAQQVSATYDLATARA